MRKLLAVTFVFFINLFLLGGAFAAINNVKLICYNLTHFQYDEDCNIDPSSWNNDTVLTNLKIEECKLNKEYYYNLSAHIIEIGQGKPVAKYDHQEPSNKSHNYRPYFSSQYFRKGQEFQQYSKIKNYFDLYKLSAISPFEEDRGRRVHYSIYSDFGSVGESYDYKYLNLIPYNGNYGVNSGMVADEEGLGAKINREELNLEYSLTKSNRSRLPNNGKNYQCEILQNSASIDEILNEKVSLLDNMQVESRRIFNKAFERIEKIREKSRMQEYGSQIKKNKI